jgi:AcrR family transcriptional regulator
MRMDTRQRIVATGREILLSEGLRAITTNEIARRARISKKTLYRIFSTKEALLEAVVVEFMEQNLSRWDEILERKTCAMERTLASLEFVSQFLPQIQTHLIHQIETIAPQLWERIDAIRLERLQKLKSLMEEAQREGFFRTEVDPDHWILLLTGTVRSVLTPKVLLRTGISLLRLVQSLKDIYYTGLLTEKGRQYIAAKETAS